MAAGFWRQLWLLAWLHSVLQTRRLLQTTMLVVFPACCLVFQIATLGTVRMDVATNYSSFSLRDCDNSFMGNYHWLAYVPNKEPTVEKLMKFINIRLNTSSVGFVNMLDLENYFLTNQSKLCFGALAFHIKGSHIEYEIRLRSDFGGWKTDEVFRWSEYENTTYGALQPGYYRNGFLSLQRAVDLSIMQSLVTDKTRSQLVDVEAVNVQLKSFPSNYRPAKLFTALCLHTAFIVLVFVVCSDLLLDKERKLKELMRTMGMKGSMYWFTYMCKYLYFIIVSGALMTALCYVMAGTMQLTLLLVFILLYAVSVVAFCFAVSSLFVSATSGILLCAVFYYFMYLPSLFLNHFKLSTTAKYAVSLDCVMAMQFGVEIMDQFNYREKPLNWTTLHESVDGHYAMVHVLVLLAIDTGIYIVVAWYIDAINPAQYGIAQPLYFPLLPTYWFGVGSCDNRYNKPLKYNAQQLGHFEDGPPGAKPTVKLRRLTKKYFCNSNPALKDVSMDLYESEIMVLLGRNGSGKSTLMSLLAGLTSPSSGTAYVGVDSIRKNIWKIREKLGVCPQVPVLFDKLSVKEHLYLFASLKGCPKRTIMNEVYAIMHAFNLQHISRTQCKFLSGGHRKKLAIGLALIGDSKFIILDDPADGLDPDARNHLYDILLTKRAGRTIFMSTHFIHEVDFFADRVAVLDKSQLRSCGSTEFIKQAYGNDYKLILMKSVGFDSNKITTVVKQKVLGAKLLNDVGLEMTFSLPRQSWRYFEPLFTILEQHYISQGIDSYGATVASIEDAFTGLLGGDQEQRALNTSNILPLGGDGQTVGNAFGIEYKHHKGIGQKLKAMFIKCFVYSWRSPLLTISQILIPLIFLAVAALVPLVLNITLRRPFPRPLTLRQFGYPVVVAWSKDYNELEDKYLDILCPEAKSEVIRGSVIDDYFMEILADFRSFTDSDRSFTDFDKRYQIAASFHHDDNAKEATCFHHDDVNDTTSCDHRSVTDQTTTKTASWTVVGHFNPSAVHAIAVSLSYVDKAILLYLFPDTNVTFTAVNHPLKYLAWTEKGLEELDCLMSLFLAVGLLFLTATFVMFPVMDRYMESKQCQVMNGVGAFTYWLPIYMWDLCLLTVTIGFIVLMVVCFKLENYTVRIDLGYLVLVLALYGLSMMSLVYIFSFVFKNSSSAFGVVMCQGLFIIFLHPLVHHYVWSVEDNFTAEIVTIVLSAVFPPYGAMETLNSMSAIYRTTNADYFHWKRPGLCRNVTIFVGQAIVFFVIVLITEACTSSSLCESWCSDKSKDHKRRKRVSFALDNRSRLVADSGVRTEMQRIGATPPSSLAQSDAVVMSELTKCYDDLCAVDHLSLGVHNGECFGIVGGDGSGKTTLFRLLTGEQRACSGLAFIAGNRVSSNVKRVRADIGYCPQIDPLINEMTGRETLNMYARLQGIIDMRAVVNRLVQAFELEADINKLTKHLSAGARRKVTVAIALLGNAKVFLLDEPTTGLDLLSKKQLWNIIFRLPQAGKTVILTSQSLEECQGLCSRMAILVNGQFQCIGNVQQLRSRYGNSFWVIVKLRQSSGESLSVEGDDIVRLMSVDEQKQVFHEELQLKIYWLTEYLSRKLPGTQLVEQHGCIVRYHVRNNSLTWAFVFGAVGRIVDRYDIEDYAVTQATLSQLFVDFMRHEQSLHQYTVPVSSRTWLQRFIPDVCC